MGNKGKTQFSFQFSLYYFFNELGNKGKQGAPEKKTDWNAIIFRKGRCQAPKVQVSGNTLNYRDALYYITFIHSN